MAKVAVPGHRGGLVVSLLVADSWCTRLHVPGHLIGFLRDD